MKETTSHLLRKRHHSKYRSGGATKYRCPLFNTEVKMTDFDFSIFDTTPSREEETTLENLIKEAENMAALKESIEEQEATLSELNKQYNYISQYIIPQMLDELGMKTLELKDGSYISVKEFISGSLPKEEDRFMTAIGWLKDNNLENILKTDVILQFGKGTDNEVKNLVAQLEEYGYEPNTKYGVHPQTLYSAIREIAKEGVVIPYELLGLFAGKKADIKLSKKHGK